MREKPFKIKKKKKIALIKNKTSNIRMNKYKIKDVYLRKNKKNTHSIKEIRYLLNN